MTTHMQSEEHLRALSSASRTAAAFTALGLTVALGSIGFAVMKLDKLDREVTNTETVIAEKRAEVAALEERKKALQAEVKEKDAFIEGKSSSATTGEGRELINDVAPQVTYERKGWRFEFAFSLDAPQEVASNIKSVTYAVPNGSDEPTALVGTGARYSAKTTMSQCNGIVEATILLKDGRKAQLMFDWCSLAHWKSSWKYDPSSLLQLDSLATNCRAPKAVLAAVPSGHPSLKYGWRAAREIYRAHPDFHPKQGQPDSIEFFEHKFRGRDVVALLAECTDSETCIGFAAAYHAITDGGRPPELYCSHVPSLEKEHQKASGLEDLKKMPLPGSGESMGSCYRLASCEGASRGKVESFPASQCVQRPNEFPTQCASRAPCSEVIQCTEAWLSEKQQ